MKKLLLVWVIVMAAFSSSLAQTRQVTGKVTSSEDGSALPGVSISLKGTARGTTSTSDGSYKIMVSNSDALVFSFVGYKSQEVKITNQSVLNIQLAVDAKSLEEIVVTGYGNQKKKDFLGSSAVGN